MGKISGSAELDEVLLAEEFRIHDEADLEELQASLVVEAQPERAKRSIKSSQRGNKAAA